MSSAIYRYELDITDYQELELPPNAVPLSVANSRSAPNRKIDMWVRVKTDDPRLWRNEVFIVGTGHPLPKGDYVTNKFIGTVVAPNGLVWHVFVGKTFLPPAK